MSYLFKSILSLCFIVFFAGYCQNCRAQYRVPLDSVAKIMFVSQTPWWSSPRYRKVEVVKEDGLWKAYQTELHLQGINEVNRKFLRPVTKNDLSLLLKLIGNSDSVIHPQLFNIDKKRVLTEFDTLLPLLKPKQKIEVAKFVGERKRLDSMITNEMRRSVGSQSDLNGYYIIISTKSNKTFNVAASANEYILGHLPWYIGKLKSFDPRISTIFDEIIGDDNHKYSLDTFYGDMVFWTYMKYFRTTLNVENLSEDFPVAYKSLTETFKILSIVSSNRIHNKTPRPIDSLYYWGGFQTPLLPKYVNLSLGFKPADTSTITSIKRYVDTIKRYFKEPNFLFEYLASSGVGIVTFSPTQNQDYVETAVNSAKKLFPGIGAYNPKEIQIVQVRGNPGLASRWLLLPDNTLLLCRYTLSLPKVEVKGGSFLNLSDSVIEKHSKESFSVCIHFDSKGQVIKDYTGADGVFFGY